MNTELVTHSPQGNALLIFLCELPAEVMLGAFAGAAIFILSATEYPPWKRTLLAMVSFFCGAGMYRQSGALLESWLPFHLPWGETGCEALGAFVVACVAVRLGTRIYRHSGPDGGSDHE